MPTVIAYGLAAIFTAGEVTAAISIIAYAVTIVGSLALSEYQKKKAERSARAQFDASQVDRLANLPLTVAPRELVVGRVRKGGTPFFRSSWGPFKDTFIMCIALAAHEIDGVEQIYFNDQPVGIDGSGNVVTEPYARVNLVSEVETMASASITLAHAPVAASIRIVKTQYDDNGFGTNPAQLQYWRMQQQETQPFTISGSTITVSGYDPDPLVIYSVAYQWANTTSFARVFWHLGSIGQASDARLQAYFPGVWTAAHQAQGVAYLLCEFVYDETAFPSGLPNVTALIRGAKIVDPRNGLTQFTENPALMMRHVLLHPQFGKRASISASEDVRIIAAANACETAIDYGGGVVNTFRAACVFPFGSAARDALDDLAQAMGGEWAYAAGEYYMHAGFYTTPVMNLFDSDLAVVQRSEGGSVSQSAITISTHQPRNSKINTVVARIWDQAAGFVETPISPMRIDAYVAADGAELTQEVTMPAVFYNYQAFHIAGIMLRDSRDPLTVTLPFKLTAYAVELFDTVTVTLSRYGWVGKPFRVLGRTFMPGGYVVLTLKETTPEIFQWGAGFIASGLSSNASGLPRPWDIHAPTVSSLTASEDDLVVQSDGTVISAVRVTWLPIQDQSIANGGLIEIQWTNVANLVWSGMTVPGNDTQHVFTGPPDNIVIAVRLRSRNSVAVSDWSGYTYVQISGKTAPPPDVQELSIAGSVLSWTMPRRVPDLAGFIFRFHYGSNLDWGSATPLHNGIITASPYDLVTRPAGVVTIMGKAIDTTGNVSLATANIVMNLGDPTIANIVEQWDFNALGWPNSAADSSGWTLVLGNPSADAIDSFYGTDDQSFYGSSTDSFYDASAYRQMLYVSNEIAVSSALAGSVMTLVTQADGTDLRIEYRLAGPSPFYGPGGDSFYGTDSNPFYEAPGSWLPWPGQIVAARDVYQFRWTIGAGPVRGVLNSAVLTIDAPDVSEELANMAISSAGTAIPYVKTYASIKTIQATLQANGSGAITVEVDKSVPLAPVIRAFDSSHIPVSGATADISIQGY